MSDATEGIVVERRIEASPDEVFQAWSDPASLARWMCPGSVRGAEVEVDFRVGGEFRIAMRGDERNFVQHGEYLEIDRPKRLVFTWVSEWIEAEFAHTRVTVVLEPDGRSHTKLRLVHDVPTRETYAGHEGGWGQILDKLAATLAN